MQPAGRFGYRRKAERQSEARRTEANRFQMLSQRFPQRCGMTWQ
jgi:hypothetical protein